MKNINELKTFIDITLSKFILLSVITLGLYPLIWIFLNQAKIMEVTGKQFATKNFPVILSVIFGLSSIVPITPNLLTLISGIMFIVWAFKAKDALQVYVLTNFKFELKMNGVYVFFFHVFYIVYCINAMESELQKHNIINARKEEPKNKEVEIATE